MKAYQRLLILLSSLTVLASCQTQTPRLASFSESTSYSQSSSTQSTEPRSSSESNETSRNKTSQTSSGESSSPSETTSFSEESTSSREASSSSIDEDGYTEITPEDARALVRENWTISGLRNLPYNTLSIETKVDENEPEVSLFERPLAFNAYVYSNLSFNLGTFGLGLASNNVVFSCKDGRLKMSFGSDDNSYFYHFNEYGLSLHSILKVGDSTVETTYSWSKREEEQTSSSQASSSEQSSSVISSQESSAEGFEAIDIEAAKEIVQSNWTEAHLAEAAYTKLEIINRNSGSEDENKQTLEGALLILQSGIILVSNITFVNDLQEESNIVLSSDGSSIHMAYEEENVGSYIREVNEYGLTTYQKLTLNDGSWNETTYLWIPSNN